MLMWALRVGVFAAFDRARGGSTDINRESHCGVDRPLSQAESRRQQPVRRGHGCAVLSALCRIEVPGTWRRILQLSGDAAAIRIEFDLVSDDPA